MAAHTDGVEARNSDVKTILTKTSFKLDPPLRSFVPERHHSRIAATTPSALVRGELFIKEHDYVIWFGDFNYRMDASKTPEEVFERVFNKDFEWLYANDQLINEMRANRVFQGFQEVAQIRFLPTYKFEPGTDSYDRRPEKKVRAPAWTDRVVWKLPPNTPSARCLIYDRIDNLRASDHKPVEAALAPVVRVINDEFRNEAYREVLKKLDGTGLSLDLKALTPEATIKVEPSLIDFGQVMYRIPVKAINLKFKNTSQVPLCWRVVARPGANDLCAAWITFEPSFGLLLAGETVEVPIECGIDLETARLASSGEYPHLLRDVLEVKIHPVLDQDSQHVAYVNIRCSVRPTCFGGELQSLLWAFKPIRVCGTGEEQYSKMIAANTLPSQSLAIPKELWRLTKKIKNRLEEHKIFLHHADPVECSKVRECLDEGTSFPKEISTYAYASVLLEFLDALADPVVPSEFFPENEDLNEMTWSSTFFSSLPTQNANVLSFVVALVQRTLLYSAQNKLNLSMIAPLFAEVLFRPNLAAEANRETSAANATGLGEFATWLTSGVYASSKNDSRSASQTAIQAFCLLVQNR